MSKTGSWWKSELSINTKKEVISKIRHIINFTQTYRPIDKINTEYLLKILSHHHDFKKKCGVGIQHLEIRQSLNKSSNSIWIIRNDNTTVDISWMTVFNKKPIKKNIQSSTYNIHYHINGSRLLFVM